MMIIIIIINGDDNGNDSGDDNGENRIIIITIIITYGGGGEQILSLRLGLFFWLQCSGEGNLGLLFPVITAGLPIGQPIRSTAERDTRIQRQRGAEAETKGRSVAEEQQKSGPMIVIVISVLLQ